VKHIRFFARMVDRLFLLLRCGDRSAAKGVACAAPELRWHGLLFFV